MYNHRSFILRMQNDEPDHKKQPRWRYILLDAERQSRRGFTSLDQLFAALVQEVSSETGREHTPAEIVQAVEELLYTITTTSNH